MIVKAIYQTPRSCTDSDYKDDYVKFMDLDIYWPYSIICRRAISEITGINKDDLDGFFLSILPFKGSRMVAYDGQGYFRRGEQQWVRTIEHEMEKVFGRVSKRFYIKAITK